ncbi:catalase [Pedobacter sp. UYP30]|uniref:catalase family peroxidase n=1 Tax=Pedobacter sp. UYP30 TaxID=1756400 RepID=UPI00339297AF
MKSLKQSIATAALIFAAMLNANAQTTETKASPKDLVDALHTAFGDNHSRAVHAKGIILQGTFIPNPAASSITKAPHLQKKTSKVTIRFSDFTGIPTIPDNITDANPRGFAIKFFLPDGSTTDIVGHSFDGFPASNPDEFQKLLLAIGASGPQAPKPTPIEVYLDSHPIAKTFLTSQHTPASFATLTYFGVNAFKFTNKEGKSRFVRYQFIPQAGLHYLTASELKSKGSNYLMEEIKSRVSSAPVKFNMYAQLSEPGDDVDDPAVAWPKNRKKILLGTISIEKVSENTMEEDKKLFFIPNNLPAGIETQDPMLDFRSKAYPISVSHRQ